MRDSAERKRRLLVIAPYPVVPPATGGMVRIHTLADRLARRGLDVTVLTPYVPMQRAKPASGAFTLRQAPPYPFALPFFLSDRLLPYGYAVSFHPGYGAMLRRFLRGFDAFQFEHAFFADLLRWLPRGRPVIYDAHNVEFDYLRDECRRPKLRDIVARRAYAQEAALLSASRLVLACSAEQRRRFWELYGVRESKIEVVPNGVQQIVAATGPHDPGPLLERFPQLRRFSVCAVFSGSNVDHNRQAVRLILDRLAPEGGEDCAFLIHGECGKRFGRYVPGNVFFDREPNSFERYANSGLVGLNPITQGSGTQMKLSQYLAHGIPVISTPFGMRGYKDLEHFITVRPVEQFVEALRSRPVYPPETPGVLREYLWDSIVDRLFERYSVAIA